MDATAPNVLQLLEASALGLAVRQSTWVYPAANVGHVVAVVAFAGAVTVMDLALLGVIKTVRRGPLIAAARRFALVLLACVALTGLVLFTAEASHVALNRVFQLKLGVIALAGANAVFLGGRAVAAARSLPEDIRLPRVARIAAAASLGLWLLVVALGRFIAYV